MNERSTTKSVARNAGALYAVQMVSFLVPVFEIPILARALGAEIYGEILFCQALALTCSLIVEYGFNVNAAQQVAIAHQDPVRLRRLFSQVLLAKVLLAAPIALLIIVGALSGMAGLHLGSPALVAFVLAYFLAFGFSPMWYFQGAERMARPAALDVALRLAGLGVLALSVRTPEDFYVALPILAIPPLLNTVLTTWWGWAQVGRLTLDVKGAWRQVRGGFHFFVYRSASNLAMSAVPVFLGLSSGKRAVGEFAPPEKLVKGMTSLAMPFLTAVFPVFARKLGLDNARGAFRQPLWVVAGIAVLAMLGTGVGVLLGPWALTALLGHGFPGSLLIYYVLIGVAPLRIVNQSMALLVLIPAGRAKSVSYVISAFSLGSVLLGWSLSVPYGGMGMAAGLLVMEGALLLILLAMTVRAARAGAAMPAGGGQ